MKDFYTNNMTHVESSCLMAVSADKENNTMDVQFLSGAVYRYFEVPEHIFSELMNAESHGIYFSHNIRTKYNYTRLN